MDDLVYLATAPNQIVAEMWQDMLGQSGVPAMLQPADAVSFYGVSAQPVRLMVAQENVDAARSLLEGWDEDDAAGDEGPDVSPDEASEGKGR
ncbi:MAG: DUF2007 domain-containing protein [Dehalococcoidia bacterium]|nr:DUF2007 domain-containing protein [Dehalococcoidia bacterium]